MSLQVKFPFGRNQGPLHTCRECGFASKERHLYERHAKRCPRVPTASSPSTSHKELPAPPGEKELPAPPVCRNYKCRKCEFATSKAKLYLYHLKDIHKENINVYPCDLCEYAAKHKSKVIRHRTLVHKGAPPSMETDKNGNSITETGGYTHSDDDVEDIDLYYQTTPTKHSSSDIVFPGGPPPPPVPHILEQNIPAPIDAADYNAPRQRHEDEYEDEEEDELSGLEMDGEDPEISFRVVSAEQGIELPDRSDQPTVASDLPHNPHPTEDAYMYIEPTEDGILSKCKICSYKNPHKWKIANHIRTIHMKRKLFKCPYCDFVCERKIEWCVHKTAHTNKTVYRCKECLYRTTMKRNFDRHLNRHLTHGPYKCGICTYSSTGEAAIQRHMAEYHLDPTKENTSPAESDTSPVASTSTGTGNGRYTPDSMEGSVDTSSHTPRSSTSPATGSGDVICRICNLAFRSESKLRIHMVAHSKVAPWACPVCPLRYKRTADLNRHMKRKHGCRLQETSKSGNDNDFEFNQDEPLNLTVVKDEPCDQEMPLDLSVSSSPSTCSDKASYNVPSSPDLDTACKALVFKPENLKCKHCSYQAKWPSDLRRHMLVHSIEKRFRCQFCNKRYKYQFDLNMHIRKTHRVSAGRTRVSTGAGPTPAARSSTLTTEQQLELEWNSMMDKDLTDGLPTMVPQRRAWEMTTSPSSSVSTSPVSATVNCTPVKLKCDFCPYLGKYRAEVERHMRLHTGNKPYACVYCEYKSFWKGDMKRHLVKHHNDQVSEHGDLHELVDATYSPSSDVQASAVSRHDFEDDIDDYDDDAEADAMDPLLDDSIVKVEPLDADENPIYLQLQKDKLPFEQYDSLPHTSVPIEQMSFEDCEVEQPNAKPGDKKVFKCPQCAFICEAPSKLKCHYEIHGNLKRFMCPTCGKRSNWLWDVRKHIRKDHPTASMNVRELTEEEASSSLEEYLITHRSPNKTPRETPTREIPTPPVGPAVLSAEVAALLEQRIHSREVSPAMSTGSTRSNPGSRYRPYKCSECGRRSNWRWDLNKHIRSAHPSAEVIVLDEEEARLTFEQEVVKRTQDDIRPKSPPKPLPPVSLQPADIARLSADRCRPFKCSKCGRRSNWKWDMSKHIRANHPSATLVILSEEEARQTIDDYLLEQQQAQQEIQRKLHVEKLKRKHPDQAPEMNEEEEEQEEEMSDEDVDIEADNEEEEMDNSAIRAALMQPVGANLGIHHHVDIQRLKRFKCSACPYRSNFRSDIGRHIKRKHVDLVARVTQLGYDEAAETLKQYRETFAKKKFVPSPSKSGSSGSLHSTPEGSPDKITSPIHVPSPAKMSKMSHDVLTTPQKTIKPKQGGHSDERNRVWRCSKCDYKDKNKMRVVTHFRKHAKGMAFLCKICGDTSDYRTSMYRHIRSKHQRKDFENTVVLTAVQLVQYTPDGEETVVQPPELNNNNNNINDNNNFAGYIWKNFKCSLCGSTSTYKGTIVRHIREKHHIEDAVPHVLTEEKISHTPPKGNTTTKADDDNESHLKCNICPFQTTKEGLLKMHKSYHKNQPGNKYKCKYCPYYVCATRMLDQHTRLHLKEQSIAAAEQRVNMSYYGSPSSSPDSKSSNRARHFCDRCPYVSINRNDYLYHKQFHRPKSTATFKCELCPYWVSQRRLLTQHQKVHQPGYREHYSRGSNSSFSSPASSPCKSIASDISTDNIMELAHIKQRIIAGKITSVPITPEKLSPKQPDEDTITMPGYIVNKNGVLMASGAYRKLHQCRRCPYTNVRLHNLKLHEKMHGFRKGNLVKCQFCDYYVGNKGLLAHHIKVHSNQYRPGHDVINDFETDKESQDKKPDTDGEVEGEDAAAEPQEENNNVVSPPKDTKPSFRPDPATQLSASSLPNKSNYYIKFDDNTGEHILERAIMKKWCCEKCPYATMKRAQFERHSMLHGSKQKYVCEYCDYSVPGYHLLLQHKKLHMLPNPNLLSVQSISNLQSLPEVPADIAAAANFPAEETDSAPVLHDHLSMYENTPYFTEPKKLYRCDRCPYTNVRRDHLLAHLKFHMIRNELTCPYCDYGVSKVHLLNQHIKVHFNTPGNEMNAQSVAEGGSSPGSSTGSTTAEQPEFIDISELKTKIKKNSADDTEKNDADEGEDKMDTESTTDETRQEVDMDIESDNKTKSDKKDDQKKKMKSKPAETTAQSSKDDKTKQTAEAETTDAKSDEKTAKDASKAADASGKDGSSATRNGEDWVCQYCDRSFNASEKLLRHEMQHLVGNKF